MLALNHDISRLLTHVFCTFIEVVKTLHIVSKRSKPHGHLSFSNCSLVDSSCRLYSLTRASSHLTAIINPTITIVTGCDESGFFMDSSSPESQIDTRLLCPGYHHVCSKQWHGNSSCVNMMLLQFRFPDISSGGSPSIILRCIFSQSSTAF